MRKLTPKSVEPYALTCKVSSQNFSERLKTMDSAVLGTLGVPEAKMYLTF